MNQRHLEAVLCERPRLRPGKGRDRGGRKPEVDWRGEKRSNQTHFSATDPEARLARRGNNREAKLSFTGHVVMDNRSGLVVDVDPTEVNEYAEREAGLRVLGRIRKGERRRTVAGEKGFNTKDFVDGCRALGYAPHVAQNINEQRGSNIDRRTTSRPGYLVSQRLPKRVEEIFG